MSSAAWRKNVGFLRWGGGGGRFAWLWLGVFFVLVGWSGSVWAGEPRASLLGADRLACAFVQGITAAFTPQGGVRLRPPLDPNRPGLTIDIVNREKHRAVLEEDRQETPGVFVTSPMGLTIFAREPGGNVTMVTVYAAYSGISDNFFMVTSKHAGGTVPHISQRYGLCRVSSPKAPAPAPPASASPPPHTP